MSQAPHVGRETELEGEDGRRWRTSRWTRGVWDALLEWARPRIPDPLSVAEKAIKMLPERLHAGIVAQAVQMSSEYLSIGSTEVQRCIASVEGRAHLMYLLIRPTHPDVTPEDAFDLLLHVGPEKSKQAFDRASGLTPKGAEKNAPAPAA